MICFFMLPLFNIANAQKADSSIEVQGQFNNNRKCNYGVLFEGYIVEMNHDIAQMCDGKKIRITGIKAGLAQTCPLYDYQSGKVDTIQNNIPGQYYYLRPAFIYQWSQQKHEWQYIWGDVNKGGK